MGTHKNRLGEAILMSSHNIGFYEDISKTMIYHQISSNTHLIFSAAVCLICISVPGQSSLERRRKSFTTLSKCYFLFLVIRPFMQRKSTPVHVKEHYSSLYDCMLSSCKMDDYNEHFIIRERVLEYVEETIKKISKK